MKVAGFLAVALTLLLTAPCALADVYVYPLVSQPRAYVEPYQADSQVQMVQPGTPSPYPPACGCPAYCTRPVYVIQPPPPAPLSVISQEDRTVYFGFNRAQLNNEAKEKLNSLAGRLISADNVTSTNIVGYADRLGTISYNKTLSRSRAENVRSYLIDRGLIKPSGIETRWVGKSEPSTHCSKYMPRAQLLRCLQPDRKVEVNINYRAQTRLQPVD